MDTKTSHKIIAAGGLAAVVAVGVTVFFLRDTPVAPVTRVAVSTAPVADTSKTLPDATAPIDAAPSPAVASPTSPVVAQNNSVNTKGADSAVAPAAPASKSARRQQAANASSDTGSRMDRRSAITAAAMDKPAVTERADTGGDLNARPMTANSFTAPQEGNTNAARAASDSEITTEVQSAIAAEGLVKDGNINVTTTQGVVALSGSVPSQSAIDQVKEVAAKVKDVRRVDTSGLILASL